MTFQVVSPLSHPGGASSPGVSVGGTSRSSLSPSTHIPCCFPQPMVQPHGAGKILQKWEFAQQRQEESKEGRMKNRRVVKPHHQNPVDDVQISPSSSSGSKSPGRAQSSHGKPEHLRLQSRASSPGSWAEVGLGLVFPGNFCSLWEKEPQVAPVNSPVPVEEQPPPRRAPQASRTPLRGGSRRPHL